MAKEPMRWAVTVDRSDRDRPDLFILSGGSMTTARDFMAEMLGDRLVRVRAVLAFSESDPESAYDPFGVLAADRAEKEAAKDETEKGAPLNRVAFNFTLADDADNTITDPAINDLARSRVSQIMRSVLIGDGFTGDLAEEAAILHLIADDAEINLASWTITTGKPNLATLSVHALTDELRNRGLPVCVFQPEDIIDDASEATPEKLALALQWLARMRGRIEDAMTEAGNQYIGMIARDEIDRD
jgi:hypothetical protein